MQYIYTYTGVYIYIYTHCIYIYKMNLYIYIVQELFSHTKFTQLLRSNTTRNISWRATNFIRASFPAPSKIKRNSSVIPFNTQRSQSVQVDALFLIIQQLGYDTNKGTKTSPVLPK